ncbi:MAG: hypothetical protein ACI9U2_005182 [Bradymonadia bacterium]|jgi:hypothetical protein
MLRYATTIALMSMPAYGQEPIPADGAPMTALPTQAPEPCGALAAGAIRLQSAEFEIDVQVTQRNVRVVLPTRLPATDARPALSLTGGAPAVPIAATQTNSIRDAHRAGILNAVLGLTEAPGPRADATCAESRIDKIDLFVGDVLVASVRRTIQKSRTPTTDVYVGVPMLEKNSAAVPEEVLREKLTAHGQACVRKVVGDGMVRGSVHLELRSDADGNFRRPTLAIDGLQRPELTFCLINAIYDDPTFAPIVPAGVHLYATWYMKPAANAVFIDHLGQ